MNRRSFLKWANLTGLAAGFPSASAFAATAPEKQAGAHEQASTANNAASPNTILLKDYRPVSIYKIPVTQVAKAKFPIIDMHSHPYAKTAAEIDEWVRNMDEVGVEKTIILTMAIGAEFDGIFRKYSKYPERFEMWCGFDLSGNWARGAWEKSTTRGRGWSRASRRRRACIPMMRAWIRCGKNVENSECRSACTWPIRSGCIRRWTGTTMG